MRLCLALFVPMLAAGCTLVDQRTFQAEAPAPTAREVERARAPERPLVSVRLDAPEMDYRPALAQAVRAAAARRPGVTFDVVALVPTQASPAEQGRRVAQGARDALAVASSVNAAGVAQDRIHLGLRGDPGDPAREVRVFAR